jgi:nucleoid-associated protein EbfC
MSDTPGFDINALLGQAMEMQQKLAAAQAEAADRRFTGSSGGGAVQVDVTGAGEFLAIRLDPSVVDRADVSMLEDLLLAAVRDASARAGAASAESMGAIAGGLGGLGGLLGPSS